MHASVCIAALKASNRNTHVARVTLQVTDEARAAIQAAEKAVDKLRQLVRFVAAACLACKDTT